MEELFLELKSFSRKLFASRDVFTGGAAWRNVSDVERRYLRIHSIDELSRC